MLEKFLGQVIAFVRFNLGDRMSAIPVPIEPAADCHDSENDQIIVCALAGEVRPCKIIKVFLCCGGCLWHHFSIATCQIAHDVTLVIIAATHRNYLQIETTFASQTHNFLANNSDILNRRLSRDST